MQALVCADCGVALRQPRSGPLPRRCPRCGKRRRNARARARVPGHAVEYTHWDAASVRRALVAEQARLDALRDAAGRVQREVERLRGRLEWLERRETETGAACRLATLNGVRQGTLRVQARGAAVGSPRRRPRRIRDGIRLVALEPFKVGLQGHAQPGRGAWHRQPNHTPRPVACTSRTAAATGLPAVRRPFSPRHCRAFPRPSTTCLPCAQPPSP